MINGTMNRAHAALAPWEGQNALDAAVTAYTSIAMLRQQVKPTHRLHGIFEGKDWAPNGQSAVPYVIGAMLMPQSRASYTGLREDDVCASSLRICLLSKVQ